VAGRSAARAGLVPIYGNLLHHSVEMFLKAALVDTVPLTVLKDKYRHDPKKLWSRFKEKIADAALGRFDATIHALHEFEELRYPDTIPHPEFFMAISWRPEAAAESYSMRPAHQYEVVITDVARLVMEILDRSSLNPKYFAAGILQDHGRAALMYENPHAGRWSLDSKDIRGID
jgi:hypothetical protein